MSLADLQSGFARAVTGSHGGARDRAVSDADAQRLAAVAADPALEVVGMLYRSWRLTKVISLLPLTTSAIDTDELAHLLAEFWRGRPAVGPYFVEECLAFLDFLATRDAMHDDRVRDMAAFERARLELHESIVDSGGRAVRDVELGIRPRHLFGRTAAPDATFDDGPHIVRGTVDATGREQWRVICGPDTGLELSVGAPAH